MRAHDPLLPLLPFLHEHLRLRLHDFAERFFPDFSVLQRDTRRIFLVERLRRVRRVFLLLLRLTRRIFLPLRDRRRERFTLRQ